MRQALAANYAQSRLLTVAEKTLLRVRGLVSEDDLQALRQRLRHQSPEWIEAELLRLRPPALGWLNATPRQLAAMLAGLDRQSAVEARWALVAWAARETWLLRCLKDLDFRVGRRDGWSLLRTFEEDQQWLWPFPEMAPWEDDQDDDWQDE